MTWTIATLAVGLLVVFALAVIGLRTKPPPPREFQPLPEDDEITPPPGPYEGEQGHCHDRSVHTP